LNAKVSDVYIAPIFKFYPEDEGNILSRVK
jgi:hypothetical protein